jgi:uncharacterized membrane protein YecN with MAPEG domain
MSHTGGFQMTLLYASLTGLLFLILAVRVSMERGRAKVDHGTNGGDERFQRAVRAQVNLAEYVAPALIMLLLLEMSGAVPGWVIHVIGAAWIIARVLHAWGLSTAMQAGRIAGSGTTYLILLALGLLTLYAALG